MRWLDRFAGMSLGRDVARTTAVVLLGVALAGCTGNAEGAGPTKIVTPTPIPASNTPTASGGSTPTSPSTAPALPEAAKANTAAGAEAFVRFYIDQVNAAWTIPDPTKLRALSTGTCQTCARFQHAAETLRADGQHYDGPAVVIKGIVQVPESRPARPVLQVAFQQQARKVLKRDGTVARTVEAQAMLNNFSLVRSQTSGWLIDGIQSVELTR